MTIKDEKHIDIVTLQVLHNISAALVASLVYMIALVGYVKDTYHLTLDVQHTLILTFWGLIVYLLFVAIEAFDKRTPKDHFMWLFR